MFHRKDLIAFQFSDDRHASDELIEQYAMHGLAGPELARFEEHLLVCELCQDRLAHEDHLTQAVRDAAPQLGGREVVAQRPRLAWALGLAAAILMIIAVGAWRFMPGPAMPPAVILLQATRGNVASPSAVAGKPLTLALDLTDLPQIAEYKLEVVDIAGHPLNQSKLFPESQQLKTTLTRGLPAGEYFVRLYTPSGELLREYALAVQ